jgi:hypothetical protein
MTIQQRILLELNRLEPSRLLATDAMACEFARAYVAGHPQCGIFESAQENADCALAADILMDMDKQSAIRLLGRLIRQSPVVLVIARENHPLDFNDFLSLGMHRLAEADAEGRTLYGFDLHTYKTVPDWLNAKYWAHPERWKP